MSNNRYILNFNEVPNDWRLKAIGAFPKSYLNHPFSYNNVLHDFHVFANDGEIVVWIASEDANKRHIVNKNNEKKLSIRYEFIATAVFSGSDCEQVAQILHIYTYYQGTLTLHKLSRDFDSTLQPLSAELPESVRVTHLTVSWPANTGTPLIVLSESDQSVYYVQYVNIPASLRLYKVENSSARFVSRIWNTVTFKDPSVVVDAFGSFQRFWTVSESGVIREWNFASTSERTFKLAHELSLKELLTKYFEDKKVPNLIELEVKKAAFSYETEKLCVFCLIRHQHDEWRVYCAILDLSEQKLTAALWLSRFVKPRTVAVQAICMSSNDLCYAALSEDSNLATALLAIFDGTTQSALDLFDNKDVSGKLLTRLFPDTETHGVIYYDTKGLCLLALCSADTILRRPVAVADTPVQELINHLQLAFTASLKPGVNRVELPQSIHRASVASLQSAVLLMENQTLEKHKKYLLFLRKGGIYKNLDSLTKWRLMGNGQDLCAKQVAVSDSKKLRGLWDEERDSKSMIEFLKFAYEESAKQGQSLEIQSVIRWVLRAAEAACDYYEENSSQLYDLSESQLPDIPSAEDIPQWTSRYKTRKLLQNILLYLTTKPERLQRFESHEIQMIVTYLWKSQSEAFLWCPADSTVKEKLEKVQKEAFHVLYEEPRFHPCLFDLCKHHKYFQGLLRIHKERRGRPERAQYDLAPLFTELQNASNIDGALFPEFALCWFADHQCNGHVLRYGALCPDVLASVINNKKSLEKHRWIYDVRQGNYGEAAKSMVDSNILNNRKLSVAEAKIKLSVASCINRAAEKGSFSSRAAPQHTRRTINKKKEIVEIQMALFGENAVENNRLMDPHQLTNMILEKLMSLESTGGSADEKTEVLFQALAVSTTHDDDETVQKAAKYAWLRAISTDIDRWEGWSLSPNLNSPDLLNTIMESTVFCKLVAEAHEEQGWGDIFVEKFLHDAETVGEWGKSNARLKGQELVHLLLKVATKVVQRADESLMMTDD